MLVLCNAVYQWAAAQPQIDDVFPISGFTLPAPSPRPYPYNETTGFPYYTVDIPEPTIDSEFDYYPGTFIDGTTAYEEDGVSILQGLDQYYTEYPPDSGIINDGVMLQVYVCAPQAALITPANPSGVWCASLHTSHKIAHKLCALTGLIALLQRW